METGIRIQDLSFRYADTEVLSNISLTAKPGEIIALLGPNGAGKTTLVKHLNGLLRPSHGTVTIHGADTNSKTTSQLSAITALLFQNPTDQICKGTVWEETIFGPKNLGYPQETIHDLAHRALLDFDLLAKKDDSPYDLGPSERKRLAIASILAMDTKIVVLDEPTAGLDSREISILETAIRQLQAHNKLSIIISHDMEFVAENATRAVCLNQGKLQFDGKTNELFENHAHVTSCGLIPPQVVRLATRLKLRSSPLTPKGFVDEFSMKMI